ncbi:MAG: Lrp/AsnC family transcriptional regulator [Gammaproteobacteria bacterium]|nr:Lrp/AsnC family transcriptional regulator [Gammaproteobacteria bacterium]
MDRKILELMQENGRISNLELAEKTALSPSPCSRRVKRLEEEGVISSFVARLNPNALDLKLMVLIQISLDRHTPERFEYFEAQVSKFNEVMECYLITGQSADYLLKVIVPDMECYQQFLLGKLTCIESVVGVHSSFVLRKVIDRTALPLEHLGQSENLQF